MSEQEFDAKNMPKVDMADYTSAHERQKLERQNQKDEKLQSKIDESTQATKEVARAQQETSNALAVSNNNNGGGSTIVESKQVPDELDNNLINIKNYSWEMGS
jgi:hypothetical protein